MALPGDLLYLPLSIGGSGEGKMAKNFLELITLLVTELEKPGMRGFLGRL